MNLLQHHLERIEKQAAADSAALVSQANQIALISDICTACRTYGAQPAPVVSVFDAKTSIYIWCGNSDQSNTIKQYMQDNGISWQHADYVSGVISWHTYQADVGGVTVEIHCNDNHNQPLYEVAA